MIFFIKWYLLVTLTGWFTFPFAFRLLPGLADRGLAFSRALGWIVWGYIFWLLCSLGILRNDPAGLLFAFAALALFSGLALWKNRDEIAGWLRTHLGLALWVEVLFLAGFTAWAIVRAANPEAAGTEKPMELAFINAILRSPTFPPHDPWLSGYAISYYYFGYVLVAMLAKLTATPGGVAFNLGISLVFALSAVGAFGLVYDLLTARSQRKAHDDEIEGAAPVFSPARAVNALLGPFFILFLGNLEGFLHALHNKGLFWTRSASGGLTSPFWQWLDITDLNLPPEGPLSWVPDKFWWWWRASRVIQDYDFTGAPKEIINEFPFFSFLLADLHPHVLTMPFALLAMALALNIFLSPNHEKLGWLKPQINQRMLAWASVFALALGIAFIWSIGAAPSLIMLLAGAVLLYLGFRGLSILWPAVQEHGIRLLIDHTDHSVEIGPTLYLSTPGYLLAALALGGLAFLNTWDFPVYVALFSAAYVWRRAEETGWDWQLAMEFVYIGLAVGLCGGLLYLPFYLGFSSQAGGVLPNLIYPTRGAQLWVMFATFFFCLFAFLAYQLWGLPEKPAELSSRRNALKWGFSLAGGAALALWILALLGSFAITLLPELGQVFMASLAAPNWNELFSMAVQRRIANSGGWITLLALSALTLAALIAGGSALQRARETAKGPAEFIKIDQFAILLILLGVLLVFSPEFFFLRDQFGWRINTIFKFYFQAWLLWSIASAYGASVVIQALSQRRQGLGIAFQCSLAILIFMGLVYPVFGLWNKTNGFNPLDGWTLNGTAYFERQAADETAAVSWLQSAPTGVVAEAVSYSGGSYTGYARVSMLSGQPAVLGWIGHESQWRGGYEEIGSRQADLETFYCGRDWEPAEAIAKKYKIRYIVIGNLERTTYVPNNATCPIGLSEGKFKRLLPIVFQQGDVTIYAIPAQDSPGESKPGLGG